MSNNHFLLILGALEVGLEGAEHPSVSYELAPIIQGLQPPTLCRSLVTIDGQPYAVTIEPADARTPVYSKQEDPECSASTHGKHTPVGGVCIGCGQVA